MFFRRSNWQPYDPTWLVELAKLQHPDLPWLQEALSCCTRMKRESDAYFYFVDGKRANLLGSEWQFETNIELESPSEGWMILDILTDHRVGGMEFVDKINV